MRVDHAKRCAARLLSRLSEIPICLIMNMLCIARSNNKYITRERRDERFSPTEKSSQRWSLIEFINANLSRSYLDSSCNERGFRELSRERHSVETSDGHIPVTWRCIRQLRDLFIQRCGEYANLRWCISSRVFFTMKFKWKFCDTFSLCVEQSDEYPPRSCKVEPSRHRLSR